MKLVRTSILLTISMATALGAAPWPQFGGPNRDGAWPIEAGDPGPGDTLVERWRQPIGSGYSGVVVADGMVYTLAQDENGEQDVALAMDARSGEERWRTPIGATYQGHTGSDDGPISTPAVADGVLFTLTGHARLSALRATDGQRLWARDLAELGAVEPFYGVATSPLVHGDLVIVFVGGSDTGLAAFDRATGALRWKNPAVGGESYGSPQIADLLGERQILFATGLGLYGLEPDDGRLAWQHTFDPPPGLVDRAPLVLDQDRVFLPLIDAPSRLYKLRKTETGVVVEEAWQSRRIGRSHGPPVAHEDLIFGFHGSLLVCVAAADGTVLWRERVYDGSAIRIGGRLAVLSAGSGTLHWIASEADGFEELDRVQVFEAGPNAVTPPSFDGKTLYVRNVRELVALDLGNGLTPPPAPRGQPATAGTARTETGAAGSPVVRWRMPLETGWTPSGDGGIAVGPDGESAYLIAGDGEHEHLVALAVSDGRERWRRPLASLPPEAADEGPGGTPVVAHGRVWAVSASCVLRTFDASDGTARWTRDLRADFGTGPLRRGCRTMPLVADEKVIVLAGGETEHRAVALDAADGDLAWTAEGIDRSFYTSPIRATLAGIDQIVVHAHLAGEGGARTSALYALALDDGRLLWQHALEANMSFYPPVDLGGDRILLSTWSSAEVVRVRRADPDGALAVELERSLPEDLSPAAVKDDLVFGFASNELVAFDAARGSIMWRQPTGWGQVTRIGDRIFVLGFTTGRLTAVDTISRSYIARGTLQVFSPGARNPTPATAVDDRTLLLRNQEEVVAVTVP